MKTVGTYEARTHFSQLLKEVANGETIEVMRHGVPVARIVPNADHDFEKAAAAIDEWARYRDEHNITLGEGVTIRELIEEGRK
jgi:prevent-host-death family protein